MPCRQCPDGRWECGPENELCQMAALRTAARKPGSAGDWKEQGAAWVPIGIGSLALCIKVSTRETKQGPVVRLEPYPVAAAKGSP